MKMPEQTKPLVLGAIGGAIIVAIAGFSWGGWMTAGSAATMAKASSASAVSLALGDICVVQFQRQPDAVAKLAELKGLSEYHQAIFLEEGGWATMPGATTPATGVSRTCATKLSAT